MNRINIIKKLKSTSNNAPDIIYKDFEINNETFTLIYSQAASSSDNINDFILRVIEENRYNIIDSYSFIKNYIPNSNLINIKNENEIFYFLSSGFTVFLFDNNKNILAFENKAKIDSQISKSENEVSLKGPNEAFCSNYELNQGMIRRRIKSESLWFDEFTIGNISKTKVSLFYLNKKADTKMVNMIKKKLNNINVEFIPNTNYIIDAISNPNRSIFPITLSTERPDFICQFLIEGRCAIMCENTSEVIVLPCTFFDFFKKPDDYYEKSTNVILNRLIRVIAFLLSILTPAIYISLMAYNLEAIPSSLLINFSIQRDGVPFTTALEISAMFFLFNILRESDVRFPGKGGSSISIVGALVLGQAAVDAGIVSPITIIIVGISSVSSLAFSSIELIDSIRWWQIIMIIFSSLFGFIGVFFAILIMLSLMLSQKSCKKDYFFPFEPFNKKAFINALFIKNKTKFRPQLIFEKRRKK